MNCIKIIDNLFLNNTSSKEELLFLLNNLEGNSITYLFNKSHEAAKKHYGKKVYMRGLIEFTNYCIRNCKYCGIRTDNKNVDKYRLTLLEIIQTVDLGYSLGYRTFVLQGGEDIYYTDDKLIEIIKKIKKKYPKVAITLSLGERSYSSYKALYEAGADRYLLRHETATRELYENLHPNSSFDNRRLCLKNLKEIGFQIGAGFMVGLPNQSNEDLVNDFIYLKELNPHMVGIGPFIPHVDTPLKNEKGGTLEKTLICLGIIRLLLPEVLLPATTALGTINPKGREMGIKAGANVVMPNLSPLYVRDKYSLYNGKICTGEEAAECRMCIEGRINSIGFEVDMSRGDNVKWRRK